MIQSFQKTLLLLISLSLFGSLYSQIIATTEDGRKALLFKDGHWEWMDEHVLGKGKLPEKNENPQPVPYETSLSGETIIIKKNGVEIDRVQLEEAEFEGGRSYRILVGSSPYLFEGEEDKVYYLQDGKQIIGDATKADQARDVAVGHYVEYVYNGYRTQVEDKEMVILFEGKEVERLPILGPEFETSGKYTVNIGEAPYLYLTSDNSVMFCGVGITGYAVSKQQAVDVAAHDFMQRVYQGRYGKIVKNELNIYENGKVIDTVPLQKAKFESGRNFSLKVGDTPYTFNDDGDEVRYLGGGVIGKAASKDMALRICVWHYITTQMEK